MSVVLAALKNILAAVQAVRTTEDAMIRATGTDGYDAAVRNYEDAHATLIICENEALATIRQSAGGVAQAPFDPYGHLTTHLDTDYWD